jgi:hypothetical protein
MNSIASDAAKPSRLNGFLSRLLLLTLCESSGTSSKHKAVFLSKDYEGWRLLLTDYNQHVKELGTKGKKRGRAAAGLAAADGDERPAKRSKGAADEESWVCCAPAASQPDI